MTTAYYEGSPHEVTTRDCLMVISLKRNNLTLIPKKCLLANIRLVQKSSLGRPEAQVLLVRSKSYYFEKRMKCRCMIISNSHAIQTTLRSEINAMPRLTRFRLTRDLINANSSILNCFY